MSPCPTLAKLGVGFALGRSQLKYGYRPWPVGRMLGTLGGGSEGTDGSERGNVGVDTRNDCEEGVVG